MNLGIDFGSTYTVVSTYRKDLKTAEALDASEASPYLPSEVSVRGDKVEVGKAAKSQNGKKGTRCYKGFKMLLSVEDPEVRKSRGYDEVYTPEKVTELFLDRTVCQILSDSHQETVENLVICAPEIWRKDINTIDARTKLRDITRAFPYVRNVKIVSEPAAASAYFAWNYYKQTGTPYRGNILLIDYGGGTLDITVTNVSTNTKKEKILMEILPLERTGAGENREGKIGSAGIVFMETVTARAIREAGIDRSEEELLEDPHFFKAVNELEEALQSMTQTITDAYDEFGYEELNADDLDEDENEFTSIFYRGEDIPITYSLMMEVYRGEIAPVLRSTLEEMFSLMDARGIHYRNPEQGDFKVALVGGFGNFCLVDHQIQEMLGWGSLIRQKAGFALGRGDREKAVSLGAALLAEGVIDIRRTAPYSIGIYATHDGKERFQYAFHKGQDIEFDRVYYPCTAEGAVVPYLISSIDRFILRFDGERKKDIVATLKPAFRRRMRQELGGNDGPTLGSIGFSLDSSECLHMHFKHYNLRTRRLEGEETSIELTKLQDLIEPVAL